MEYFFFFLIYKRIAGKKEIPIYIYFVSKTIRFKQKEKEIRIRKVYSSFRVDGKSRKREKKISKDFKKFQKSNSNRWEDLRNYTMVNYQKF